MVPFVSSCILFLKYLLPLSINVFDEAVRDTIPGSSLVGGLTKDGVVSGVGGRMDHGHSRLVPVNVIAFPEASLVTI